MVVDIKEVDVDFEDVEIDPKTKKLIEELSEGLEPGEDWLHYDRDRLFPPPPAPPSEAKEHIVAKVPRTRPRQDGVEPEVARPQRADDADVAPISEHEREDISSSKRGREHSHEGHDAQNDNELERHARTAPTLDGVPLPFVPENARQARAVRQRMLRKAAVMAVVLVALLGVVAAVWSFLQRPATPEPRPMPNSTAPTEPGATTTAASEPKPAPPTAAPPAPTTALTPAPDTTPGRRQPAPAPATKTAPAPTNEPLPTATASSTPAAPAPAPTPTPTVPFYVPGAGQW